MRPIILLAVLSASLTLAPSPLAQTPGTCALGDAEAELDIGDVAARLYNKGNLFYDGGDALYEVPKGGGVSPTFTAGLWVGGFVGGDLRVAAATYAQGGTNWEFWPGPLGPGATLPDPTDCSAFDRIWRVDVFDLQQFDDTGIATDDLAEWPTDLGAPFTDANGDDAYDLADGDRPLVYGHETAFWVMNDVGGEHLTTLTDPIGLEVRVTAFASGEVGLGRQTFYRYELVNRNSLPFEDAVFTFWNDPDLGYSLDDYVGTDPARSLAYVYNADNDDDASAGGYGLNPPALGVDLLTGAERSMYFTNVSDSLVGNPEGGADFFNYMRARWLDGTPLIEGGDGYGPAGIPASHPFPGDPAVPAYWSERCPQPECLGTPLPPDDRRHVISSETFTLAPGEARTFDVGMLFAQGADYLDSVTELRAVSDAVQARYDDGTLFAPGPPPPPPGSLATPELLAPADGTTFVDEPALLVWSAVPGAESYRIEVAPDGDFDAAEVFYSEEPSFSFQGPANEVLPYAWRVQATAPGLLTSFVSDTRSFTFYRYGFDQFGFGRGIVEVANPNAEVCPDFGDPGCDEYGGNTVWLDSNVTGDYIVTTEDNSLSDLLTNADVFDGDNLEMRFTDACATPGACLGVYSSAAPSGNDLITSVPFELWNAGAKGDGTDDVRMIPILRPPAVGDDDPVENWENTFSSEAQEVIVTGDLLELPVTHRVLWMMPDRDDGYAQFEFAALDFGGVGATYDPEADGDTQIDLNPATGEDCRSQRYYVDFCYRGGHPRLTSLLGGTRGMQLADLAQDGTTPPAGTVIRFDANERLLAVGAEDDAPRQPAGFALGAVYPNPFRSSATVPFTVERPGRVRLAVFDLLGREVAVLADGEMVAGSHRAVLSGAGLASGVYLVMLEAGGQRQATKVLLMR